MLPFWRMDSSPTPQSMQPENAKPDVERPLRLAAIDVGTNSIRLLIAERDDEGGYRVLDEEKVTPRLGHGMAETGLIAPDRMESAIDAVGRMKQIALGYGVAEIRVIATSAVREASNGSEFVQGVKRTSNLAVQVIGHDDEGRLAHTSVAAAFDIEGLAFAVADIGGGSTEVVFSDGGVVERVVGLKLGAVRVADMFGGKGVTETKAFDEMRQFLRGEIESAVAGVAVEPTVLFGTGGTYAALASIQLAKEGQAFDSVQGQRLTREQVTRTLKDLRSSLAKGGGVAGLNKDRQDIIVPGAAIVEALMKTLKIDELVVHDRGIRDGLMLTMMDAQTEGAIASLVPPEASAPRAATGGRSEAIRRFARQCRYHAAHSEHVTRLSLEIFDQLAERLPELAGALAKTSPTHPLVLDAATAMDGEARAILEAAGVLHDIGYLVNHSKHHKHSYYIIANGDLDGFTPRERELIANVARYHRRSHPKGSHEAYRALDPHDRKIVRRLAGVLRVADGLDRTHTQVVERVTVDIETRAPHEHNADHPNTAVFRIDAPDDVSTDIWGAQRKAELFALAFGLRCAFEVV